MTGFHEIRFPDNIAYGATGGPEFATTVVATGAGHEKRNVNWSEARGRWDVASGLKKQAQIDELIAFFRARRGKAYGFRFKDWTDYKATGQLLGTGDDVLTLFQLIKHYPSGSVIEVRTIAKPAAGTVKVYLDGVEQLSGWSVDTATGLVTFSTAPVIDVEVTADFEFDVPLGQAGDTYDRYLVRIEEFHQSVRIIRQALDGLPEGPIVGKVPRLIKPPAGETYHAIESPKGEIGYFIVSDGKSNVPYRFRVRPPSFCNLQALPRLIKGHLVADVVALIGSIDIVLGEVDR